MRLVLDTNVLVSAIVFGGPPRDVLETVLTGAHRLVLSPAILHELHRVLTGSKFRYAQAAADQVDAELREIAEIVEPETRLSVIAADPEDNRVLECAVEGGADVIVSGDRDLLGPWPLRRDPGLPPTGVPGAGSIDPIGEARPPVDADRRPSRHSRCLPPGELRSSADLLEDGEHRGVDLAVARHQGGRVEVERATRQVRHAAARFLDEQAARGRIPRPEPELPITVEAARCEPGEVENGRAHPPHAAGPHGERGVLPEGVVGGPACVG